MLKVEWSKKTLIRSMRRDVMAYNKQYSIEIIKSFNFIDLLARCHPIYREDYEKAAIQLKIIEK